MAKNKKYNIKPLKNEIFMKNQESYKFGFKNLKLKKI